jgi:hypothetical protein
MDKDCWIQTFTGKKFYPLNPEESEYCIEDIAHALSNICRFTGHCNKFYSVAQHSQLLSLIVSEGLAKAALLHDASEAYLTDIARPLKHLPQLEGYRKIERRTQIAIDNAFNNIMFDSPQVKEFDTLLLRNEAKCLGLLKPDWDHYQLIDIGIPIHPMPPEEAERVFLKRWDEVKRHG